MNKFVPTALAAALCSAVFAASAAVPVITDGVSKSAALIHADPAMQALLAEATSEEAQKWRFNTLLELARIASPSRFEMRRQAEITRRLVEEWGFAPEDVLTRPDGFLKGAGVQTVDGKPVYNVCVRIPGTYGARPDAVSYKGQLPKVVLEGHIDTVNPGVLPPAETPYEAVKLQKVSDPIVKTREELKALALEVRFDKNGKVIEDEVWKKAYHRFNDLEEAKKKGGYRIYVPGFEDAMINTVAVMQTAKLMKKHNIRPVYDIWVCGTTGEEGKGNLCGMKQLYGYSQEAGKGNNALNIVANFGADSTMPGDAIVNYIGSYRFEIKYTEPAGWKAGEARPSAAMAMSRAIASISDLKTAWDLDKKAEKTTYTVGVASCDDPAKSRSTNCTLMVDMRSPTQAPLSAIRAQIEPEFKKAMDAENAKYGLKTGDKNAVSMELVWFGDRPAYQRPHYNDIAMQAYWQASKTADIDVVKAVPEEAASLND
ncbi:MAG: peptidase M20, partial [Sutterella wadsworthensis]|nr:peptidase M20 [Sutterella wadsworthensis]